jgi:hypothetical protein
MQPAISIPESTAFTALEVLERKVDYLMQQKRSEVREAVLLPEHTKQKLCLYISHIHAHQQRPHSDTTMSSRHRSTSLPPHSSEPPSWTLLITGRILNPDPSAGPASNSRPGVSHKTGEAAASRSSSSAAGVLPPTFPGGIPALPSAAPPGSSQAGMAPSNQAAGEAAGAPGASSQLDNMHPACFYFRRVEVKLDPELYPGPEGIFVWDKVFVTVVFQEL